MVQPFASHSTSTNAARNPFSGFGNSIFPTFASCVFQRDLRKSVVSESAIHTRQFTTDPSADTVHTFLLSSYFQVTFGSGWSKIWLLPNAARVFTARSGIICFFPSTSTSRRSCPAFGT
jgi:hypothetical protein